jgi:hypothetical protein
MQIKLRFLISLVLMLAVMIACSSNKSDKDKGNQTNQNNQQQQKPESKDQYRMSEMFEDDKSQMIDLIEGKANFVIIFEGEGNFKANVLTTDGKLIEVLADVNGNYKGKKTINVPQTTAYVLDVHCKGKWSVYRE